jgi:urease
MLFVSQLSVDTGTIDSYKLRKRIVPVKNCNNIGKKDMKLNTAMPLIKVDPETYAVTADGIDCTCDPVSSLPMTQSIFLF